MKRFLLQYPVGLFIGLTLVLTFAAYLLPLPAESKPILFPIVVTFIPTLVAAGLAASAGSRASRALYSTLRPGKLSWLGISILIGAGMQVAIALLALILGYIDSVQVTASPLLVSLAFLMPLFALGEELGWRGFALPKLLPSQSRLSASLIAA